MAEYLDREHQWGKPPNGSNEVLEIRQAVLPESLDVIVEPCDQSTSQGNHRHPCRRFLPGDQPHQIASQDEQPKRHQVRNVALIVMSYDLLAKSAGKSFNALH